MIAYRFAYDLYLPTSWAYGDESDALPGAQVWKDEAIVARAAVGGDVDGRYDDQPRLLVLDVAGCSGDDGGCDWPVILPSDLRGARSVPTSAFAAWVTEQTGIALDVPDEDVTDTDVCHWAEDHRADIEAWLLENSSPVALEWRETIAG